MNRGCQESKPINPNHQSTVKLNFCWWVDDQLRSLTNEFIAEGSSSWSSTEAETRIWKSSHQNVRQFDLLPSSFVASQVFFCWSLFWVFVFLASIFLAPVIILRCRACWRICTNTTGNVGSTQCCQPSFLVSTLWNLRGDMLVPRAWSHRMPLGLS